MHSGLSSAHFQEGATSLSGPLSLFYPFHSRLFTFYTPFPSSFSLSRQGPRCQAKKNAILENKNNCASFSSGWYNPDHNCDHRRARGVRHEARSAFPRGGEEGERPQRFCVFNEVLDQEREGPSAQPLGEPFVGSHRAPSSEQAEDSNRGGEEARRLGLRRAAAQSRR